MEFAGNFAADFFGNELVYRDKFGGKSFRILRAYAREKSARNCAFFGVLPAMYKNKKRLSNIKKIRNIEEQTD